MISRVPPRKPSPASAGGGAAANEVAALAKAQAEGKTPAEVFASLPEALVSPAAGLGGTFEGYTFDPKDVDFVMKRYGLADVKALLTMAIAQKRGSKTLSRAELLTAAKKASAYVKAGVKVTPSLVADVMKKTGVAEEGALVRAAIALDDGDKVITRDELELAAELIGSIVKAHDVGALVSRVDAIAAGGEARVDVLGSVDGFPIQQLTFPARTQPPKLTVFVSGGVHGNEPCGAAAALLFAEQLAHVSPGSSPGSSAGGKLRDDVEVVVVPLVNPRGMAQGTRRTPEDVDINRTFADDHAPAETKLVAQALARVKPQLALDLHSGKARRDGFWLIHQGGGEIAKDAMQRFRERWPALHSDPAPYVLEVPGVSESANEGTLKSAAVAAGADAAFTIEAPGSVGYVDQVLGENELLYALIEARLVRG